MARGLNLPYLIFSPLPFPPPSPPNKITNSPTAMNKDVGNHIFLYIGNNFYVSIDFKKRLIRKEFHWLTIFFESMYAVVINSSMNFNNKGVCQKLWQCDQCVNEIAKKHMDFTPPPKSNDIRYIEWNLHYYNSFSLL